MSTTKLQGIRNRKLISGTVLVLVEGRQGQKALLSVRVECVSQLLRRRRYGWRDGRPRIAPSVLPPIELVTGFHAPSTRGRVVVGGRMFERKGTLTFKALLCLMPDVYVTQIAYFVVCFGLCVPIFAFPLLSVDPSEEGIAVGQRFGVRANVWIAIYSFIGNYW